MNELSHPEDRKILKTELTQSKLLGQTADNKKIYLYSYHEDSVVLREIGRLREISFRKVGEGVNKKRDTDKYDKYYDHIILWDENDLEIVGSYRIGESQKIYAQLGYDGFYSHTLFTFNQSFTPYLKNSIELGRSFVQPKYWGSRALDYLWYGIGAYLAQNPNIKYMFGPVSLSSNYPLFAQSLLIYFYELYFANKENLVSATTPFKAHHETSFAQETSKLFVKNDYQQDFKTLKKILASIGFSVPTLYKQYTEITHEGGSMFLGFNIDPLFNNCIDGFILVDVEKIKENQRNRYIPSTKL